MKPQVQREEYIMSAQNIYYKCLSSHCAESTAERGRT